MRLSGPILVEPVGCHLSAIYWTRDECAPCLIHAESCPIILFSLYKMVPDVVLVGSGLWNSPYSITACLVSAALSLLLVQSNRPARWPVLSLGLSPVFPVNPHSYLVAGGFPATGGIQITVHWMPLRYLVTTSYRCFHCFSVSISLHVPLCHQSGICCSIPEIFYFLEYALSASQWLIFLHLFHCFDIFFKHVTI